MNPTLFLVSCCCLRVPHTQLCFRKCASTVVTRIPSVPSRKVVHSWQGTRRLGFRMVSESSVSHNIVRARHILVETEAMADALLQQLRQGQDFSELAKTVSRCTSKVRGGELGWFRRNTMVAPFEDACFQAKPGELRKVQTVSDTTCRL